MVKAIEKPSQV